MRADKRLKKIMKEIMDGTYDDSVEKEFFKDCTPHNPKDYKDIQPGFVTVIGGE